jgi:predicted enzyme related to lactoylglutathione lyase
MADKKTVRGRVVWHELMTPDSAAAHGFYTKVLGWKTQAWEHDPSYAMFAASSGPLGAAVAQTESPPYWRHYIATPDFDATLEQAQSLGGSVIVEPAALPDGGRYAVLTDPQGAVFGVFSPAMPGGPDKPPKVGQFSWLELATTDAKAALDFYCDLFGWNISAEHDMGPLGIYYLFDCNGRAIGGAFNKPAEMPGPPAWLGYVRVKDLDKTVKRAGKAGAKLLNGPMEVPGGDWIAQLADPQGAMFAVHALKADVQPAVAEPPPATPPSPATKIEVSAAPAPAPKTAASTRLKSKPKAKARPKPEARPKPKARAKSKARPKSKTSTRVARKRAAAKTAKRSVRKAVRVSNRKVKAKAGRKKSASRSKKKAGAKARKGK